MVSTVIHDSSRTALECALHFISEHANLYSFERSMYLFSFEVNKNLPLQIKLNPGYAKNVIRNADYGERKLCLFPTFQWLKIITLTFVLCSRWIGMMWSIYEMIHIWTAVVDDSEEWSLQLIFQLLKLERQSLKKIRASMVFEPMTSAIPVQCFTNWAMKPHIGSEVNLLSSYLPWGVKWCEVYMK